MNKSGCTIIGLYRMAIAGGIVFAVWRCARHWHAGLAEKIGRTIDTSIKTTADKLDKAAMALEEWGENGLGENLGKGLDEILTDTKMALESATDIVQRALHHAKKE